MRSLFLMCCITSSLMGVLPDFLQQPTPWADTLIRNMSLRNKIAHLFFINIPLNSTHEDLDTIALFLRKNPVGGIYLGDMNGAKTTIKRQVEIVNFLQDQSVYPLLVCQDLELGLPMRLLEGPRLPTAQTIGTLSDADVYEHGCMLARHAKAVGVHMTATPVADINIEHENPIIGFRAFGDTVDRVTFCSLFHAQALHDERSLGCAKHFPGHGRTRLDSHITLPTVDADKEALEKTDLHPFQELINGGIPLIMVGHLVVPALDPTLRPATISSQIVQKLLREKMGFQGLIMSDAMTMGALGSIPGVTANVEAIKAGIDILIFPQDVETSIDAIMKEISNGIITEEIITEKVHKILKAKEWLRVHLNRYTAYPSSETFYNQQDVQLRKKIYYHSFALINGLTPHAKENIACLNVSEAHYFVHDLAEHGIEIVEHTNIPNKNIIVPLITSLRGKYKQEIHDILHSRCLLALFGNKSALQTLPKLPGFTIDNADKEAQECAADLLMKTIISSTHS